MALTDPALVELAELFGIATEFWDWKGHHSEVTEQTVVAVLAALGVDATDPDKAAQAAADRRLRPWRRAVPPCLVLEQGTGGVVNVHVPHGRPAHLVVRLEDGGMRTLTQIDNFTEPREVDGVLTGEASFQLPPDLPLGYHRMVLTSDDRTSDGTLIVTPSFLGLPAALGQRRIWGYAAQLYSVRSTGSWGVGDLTDLGDLAIWSATQQYAGYVLINPLHAADAEPPITPSPYLPTSRLFVNPMYIRPEMIPEFADLDDESRARVRQLHDELVVALRGLTRIERDKSWQAKMMALRLIYTAGRRAARQMEFADFRRQSGRSLSDFANWSVLCHYFGNDWREWAPEFRRPTSPQVQAFREQHRDEMEFVEWLQWVVTDQLSGAQQAAKDAGMPVGIVTDLAVGVSESSADAWMMADVYAKGVTVGAPPDAYNQLGQEWGQPPWRPDRLEDLAYAPFRSMVATALRHSGGVRIDHVLGMFRLWWIPKGLSPKEGTYVRFDHDAMVGIIALEALRSGGMVIGEDLGTVEPWVRDYLARRGILGTSVLWFENDSAGNPRPPEAWRRLCLASVVTHDLPPSAGYLALEHVKLRHELGLLTESLEQETALAMAEQARWRNYLHAHNAIDPTVGDPVEAEVLGLHKFLTWTPSQVLSVALVDAVGDTKAQNQPGTDKEYPNWQVPLCGPDGKPLLLEDVFIMPRTMRLSAVLNGFTNVPAPWHPDEGRYGWLECSHQGWR